MPRDAEDDEGVAGDGAEGHHGDQEVLEGKRRNHFPLDGAYFTQYIQVGCLLLDWVGFLVKRTSLEQLAIQICRKICGLGCVTHALAGT